MGVQRGAGGRGEPTAGPMGQGVQPRCGTALVLEVPPHVSWVGALASDAALHQGSPRFPPQWEGRIHSEHILYHRHAPSIQRQRQQSKRLGMGRAMSPARDGGVHSRLGGAGQAAPCPLSFGSLLSSF